MNVGYGDGKYRSHSTSSISRIGVGRSGGTGSGNYRGDIDVIGGPDKHKTFKNDKHDKHEKYSKHDKYDKLPKYPSSSSSLPSRSSLIDAIHPNPIEYRSDPHGSKEFDSEARLREVKRCSHFEQDHYCKQLTNCPFFHEGIDCIRFFTRQPCTGNTCKFKHRVILPDSREKEKKYKDMESHKERDDEHHKGKERDVHRDKSFYLKSKPPDDNKKRMHTDHIGTKETTDTISQDHAKRIKKKSSEDVSSGGAIKGIERRPSGGLEISLPVNWKAAWSKQGEIYYYNTVTGERTWHLPSDKPTRDGDRVESRGVKEKRSYDDKDKERNKDDRASRSHKRDKRKEVDRETEKEKGKELAKEKEAQKDVAKGNGVHEESTSAINGDHSMEVRDSLPTTNNNMDHIDNELEVEEDPPTLPARTPNIRSDAIKVFAQTPILTNLLNPALREMVVHLQQQASTSCKPKPSFLLPSNTSKAPQPTKQVLDNISVPCIRCSLPPTLPGFTDAIRASLRSHCCQQCAQQMDHESDVIRLQQLHMTPSLYSTNKDPAFEDSIGNIHTSLLNLYKNTKRW